MERFEMRTILPTSVLLTFAMVACTPASDPGSSGDEGGGIDVPGGTTGMDPGDPPPTDDDTPPPPPPEDDGESGQTTSAEETDEGGSSTSGDDSESDDGTTTAGADDGATTMDCPSAAVEFEPVVPTVILLIDQSGSMTADFGGKSRWNAVRDALVDPVTGVVGSLQDDVRFGLALYTSLNGDAGGECPVLTEVTPLVGNFVSISDTFSDNAPQDETPTGESIAAVSQALLADPDDGPKIIVLATDGEPDTCAVPNPQEGQADSVAAAEAAHAAGIETFIISVGSDVGEAHLQDMANAGRGWMPGDADEPFYVPADQAAMVAAFEDIINGVRSCVLTLDTAILPGQGDQGTVTVNGVEIPYDDPDGWRVNSATEIELLGAACQMIQDGDVDVQVEFTCEAILPG